jgi:hypothetical protein
MVTNHTGEKADMRGAIGVGERLGDDALIDAR